jgi:hypothetical protein
VPKLDIDTADLQNLSSDSMVRSFHHAIQSTQTICLFIVNYLFKLLFSLSALTQSHFMAFLLLLSLYFAHSLRSYPSRIAVFVCKMDHSEPDITHFYFFTLITVDFFIITALFSRIEKYLLKTFYYLFSLYFLSSTLILLL